MGANIGVAGGDISARGAVGGLGDVFSISITGNKFSVAEAAVGAIMGVVGGKGDTGGGGAIEGLIDVFSIGYTTERFSPVV